ncbi:unnamed protein product [Blumeria hordei]|uniref:Uncharacterized protein n=1 Tax=Blumeria hordei TaxID=2867405 RepID=A0A383UXK2_BLUHO|nr:unnamed protein product [Blumeria hordei]
MKHPQGTARQTLKLLSQGNGEFRIIFLESSHHLNFQ